MLLIDEQRAMKYMNHIAIHLGMMYFYRFLLIHSFSGLLDHCKELGNSMEILFTYFADEPLATDLDSPVPFQEDWFRFRSHEEFEANCDLKDQRNSACLCSLYSFFVVQHSRHFPALFFGWLLPYWLGNEILYIRSQTPSVSVVVAYLSTSTTSAISLDDLYRSRSPMS
ncbi:hypothetical protein YC2023_086808 [Brassica napus]